MRIVVFLAALLAGCTNLIPVCEEGSECWAARCSKGTGTTGGLLTNTSISAEWEQVTFYGNVPEVVTVTPECEVSVGAPAPEG